MTSPNVPRNAYTDAPEQHPNLIVGSLQLLFWIFFHPSAWRNHIAQINATLHPGSDLTKHSSSWNSTFWWLLIQAYLVLPVLVNLPIVLVQWGLAEYGENIGLPIDFDVLLSAVFGAALGVALGVRSIRALSVMFILALSLMFTLARSVTPDIVANAVRDITVSVEFIAASSPAVILVGSSVLLMLLGTYKYFFSSGEKGKQSGLKILKNAIIGLIISLLPYMIIGLIIWLIRRDLLVGTPTIDFASISDPVNHLARSWTVMGMALSIAFMLYGGRLFMISNGSEELVKNGRKIVFNATICFIVSLMAYVIITVLGGLLIIPRTKNFFHVAVFGLGATLNLWRPVILYPLLLVWNTLLYELDKRHTDINPSLLQWHSAFWDEWQWLRWYGLDKYVLLVRERNPDEGKAALNYLSTSRQRWAAQAIQIELDARELERCKDLADISKTYRYLALGELDSPVSFTLSSFSRISKDVAAALNQNSSYNQRLALTTVLERLNLLIRGLTRSGDKYSVRFHPIATRWYQIVTNYVRELAEAVELRQEIDNPYIIGVPLSQQQKIFVKPADISGTYISTRIEQLLLDRRRPPLLLYGQRRMGKTSLLNNLGRLLPSTIIPMFVDLQGPVSSARDYAGFLYNIARSMATSAKRQGALTLPSLNRETLQDDPFTRFDEWLEKVEEVLKQNIALLALDEFEALDNAIRKGRFDEENVLGMLRHLIQHRPRFKVLLAGSHTIEEFQRWASYLINVQVVHISYLKQPEARQLIEQPVQDFTLRYEPNAVERVLQLTRCHPFLIQLLGGEIIALKNEQEPSIRRLAILADVEAAIPEALSKGSFFFADIQNNQVDAAGLAILRFLAAKGEKKIVSRKTILQQFPDEYDALDLLLQRELIEEFGDGYRFQVELIRRWFAASVK